MSRSAVRRIHKALSVMIATLLVLTSMFGTPAGFPEPLGAPVAWAANQPEITIGAPETITIGQPATVTTAVYNPGDGQAYDQVRFRITVDAPDAFTSADQVTVVAAEGDPAAGQSVAFEDPAGHGGDLVGWWGPQTGFSMAPGYEGTTTFSVTIKSGAPTGAYTLTVELLDWTAAPGSPLASEVVTVVVTPPQPEVTFIFTGLTTLVADTEGEVSITATVRDNGAIRPDTPLRYRLSLTKDGVPAGNVTIKYPEPDDAWPTGYHTLTTDANGQAYFGPADGFTLSSLPDLLEPAGVTTPFRVTLEAGDYMLKVELLDWSDRDAPKTLGSPAVQHFKVLSGGPAVVYVDDEGNDANPGTETAPKGTIQAAIAAVAPGGTVWVRPGTYNENVSITKPVTLLSTDGRDKTTIRGDGSSALLGTVVVRSGVNDVQIGDVGHGFRIEGIDSPTPAVEKAALYIQGDHSNVKVIGNELVANGDAALMTEFSAAITGLEIRGNVFSGKTFLGPNPAGDGFNEQFTWPNVPRQLVVIGGGPGGGNTKGVTFTGNHIVGTAGGINPSGREQGNTLVTIDAQDATITDNRFEGTTARFGASLRARGTDTHIEGNTFRSTNMGRNTAHLIVAAGTLGQNIGAVVAANDFDKGAYVEDGLGVGVSIQAVVDSALEGSTVNVIPGLYNEKLTTRKTLTLLGDLQNKGVVIQNTVANGTAVVSLEADNIRFEGFTVRNTGTGPAMSTSANYSGYRICNNVLEQSTFGLYLHSNGTQQTVVCGNVFRNNNGPGSASGDGIYSDQGLSNARIEDNRFVEHKSAAIVLTTARSGVFVENVTIAHNELDNTIALFNAKNVYVSDNVRNSATASANAGSGIYIGGGADGVTIENNTLHDASTGIAIVGAVNRNITVKGNRIAGSSRRGLNITAGAYEGTLNVKDNIFENNPVQVQDSSGGAVDIAGVLGANFFDRAVTVASGEALLPTIWGSIQAAVDAAPSGATIRVLPGTYKERVVLPPSKSDIKIQGAGRNQTILEGPAGESGYTVTLTSPNAVIEGLTIRKGASNDSIGVSWGYQGKGSKLLNNEIRGYITGVYLASGLQGATIENNDITGNANGILFEDASNVTIRYNRIVDNDLEDPYWAPWKAPSAGIRILPSYKGAGNIIERNKIAGNGTPAVGIHNASEQRIAAPGNWWGAFNGPRRDTVGSGDAVIGPVDFAPWYVDANMTTLSNQPSSPPGGGESGVTSPEPVILGSVSQTITPGQPATVTAGDGALTITVPANALDSGATLTVAPVADGAEPAPGAGLIKIGDQVFEIRIEDAEGNEVRQFKQPLELTFTYDPNSLPEGVSEEHLQVFYWDEELKAWIVVPSERDPAGGTVRAKVDHLTIFALMAAPQLRVPTDIGSHWARAEILKLVSLGIAGGFEDGTFRPDATVTRAQFAKMLVEALGRDPVAEPKLSFRDPVPAWAAGYVAAAVDAGLVGGFSDGTFRPGAPITREQLAAMLVRAAGAAPGGQTTFADRSGIGAWAEPSVATAVRLGLITGFQDNTFRPQASTTRAQAAAVIARLLSYLR